MLSSALPVARRLALRPIGLRVNAQWLERPPSRMIPFVLLPRAWNLRTAADCRANRGHMRTRNRAFRTLKLSCFRAQEVKQPRPHSLLRQVQCLMPHQRSPPLRRPHQKKSSRLRICPWCLHHPPVEKSRPPRRLQSRLSAAWTQIPHYHLPPHHARMRLRPVARPPRRRRRLLLRQLRRGEVGASAVSCYILSCSAALAMQEGSTTPCSQTTSTTSSRSMCHLAKMLCFSSKSGNIASVSQI